MINGKNNNTKKKRKKKEKKIISSLVEEKEEEEQQQEIEELREYIITLEKYCEDLANLNIGVLPNCTRVEVIQASKGRVYTNTNCTKVETQMQDDDKTLKIFII